MSMTDAVVSLILVVVCALALRYAWMRLWPSDKSAADLGYMPDSDSPPWGWGVSIALGLVVVWLILFAPFMVVRLL